MTTESGAQDDAGTGAPAGESGEPGSKTLPPKDEKDYVPKAQFLAALKSATDKYHALEVKLAELQGKAAASEKQADTPKRYTKAELNAAVQAGQITADVADEVWAKQIREDAKAEATRDVLGTVRAERRQERINSDLAEYKRLDPSVMEEGSETRQKIRESFEYLTGTLGYPATLETELAAIREVLGPLERLKTARSARRETEAHEETGGAGEGQQRKSAKTGWDALDARQKAHYDKLIGQGVYKDRKAVEEELKFARTRAR